MGVDKKGVESGRKWGIILVWDLIETLWDVKKLVQTVLKVAAGRFNRNIVGCKAISGDMWDKIAYRFNRNIVGCKEKVFIKKHIVNIDLIETLWDVKNANFDTFATAMADLIETLWDVKIFLICTL